MIEHILKILKSGAKSELMMNLLIYADIAAWDYEHIGILVEELRSITKSGIYDNKIMLCYNPLMTICLGCEFMLKVADCKYISLTSI